MQELIDAVWASPRLHDLSGRLRRAWVAKEIGSSSSDPPTVGEVAQAVEAAVILACSTDGNHRRTAYRIATSAFELHGTATLPLDQAVRVVLGRLGNFPAIGTRRQVADAQHLLPLGLLTEELAASDLRTVALPGRSAILTDFQHALWTRLRGGRRVAIAAPTSAGKSYVLQNHLASLFAEPAARSVLYLVPTRALITQVARAMRDSLADLQGEAPIVATVPVEPVLLLPTRAIYVMTQERAQIMLAAHPGFAPEVVVVDEAHGVGEGARGVRLQAAVEELLKRRPAAQILFASPGVRNLEVFGRMLGVGDVEPLRSLEPAVAQNFIRVDVVDSDRGELRIGLADDPAGAPPIAEIALRRRTSTRVERLANIASELGKTATNIVYANGAAEAEDVALALADLVGPIEPTPAQIELRRVAAESVHAEYALTRCVVRGVAFHYSNMPTQLRLAIEQAVAAGHIHHLVCTSTLLQGVNLPAKNIFMFRPEKGQHTPLSGVDFWNLAGRAGRLMKEFQGNIFLIDYSDWRSKPLEQETDADIVPAVEGGVLRSAPLLQIINRLTSGNADEPDLEAVFVQLLGKFRDGTLPSALERIQADRALPPQSAATLETALRQASEDVQLPQHVLQRSPDISAHKQQMLYDWLANRLPEAGPLALIPKHPKDYGAYASYADALQICHRTLLGLSRTSNFHRFIALIALWWMQGRALPRIVQNQLERNAEKERRLVVRDTLELVERHVRFQCVRLLGCYQAVLGHLLVETGHAQAVASMPEVALYLEMGAADRTTISLMSLGISRPIATRLSAGAPSRSLDVSDALAWLASAPPAVLRLGISAREEVDDVTGRSTIELR
ncbi:DEAD/DEAH box helicase [uncultured Sphingomonas sp.]|uniref:DEAD/DEAH box helicase n=1 Tax=uncultured Sphingomonas sp. TaxID=158754 RepID=UPI0035CA5B82